MAGQLFEPVALVPTGWRALSEIAAGQAWQIAVDHRGEVLERRAADACTDTSTSQFTFTLRAIL